MRVRVRVRVRVGVRLCTEFNSTRVKTCPYPDPNVHPSRARSVTFIIASRKIGLYLASLVITWLGLGPGVRVWA